MPMDLEQRTFNKIFKLTGRFCIPCMLDGMSIEPNSRLAVIMLWSTMFVNNWDRGWKR